VALIVVFALGVTGAFVLRDRDSTSDMAKALLDDQNYDTARQLGEPALGRNIVEPALENGPFAFIASDVPALAEAISASSALDDPA